MLTQCLGVPHISTGDMLRDRIRQGSEVATGVAATHAVRARWFPTNW